MWRPGRRSSKKLWDDPVFEARHRALALEVSKRWQTERILVRFGAFFEEHAKRKATSDQARESLSMNVGGRPPLSPSSFAPIASNQRRTFVFVLKVLPKSKPRFR